MSNRTREPNWNDGGPTPWDEDAKFRAWIHDLDEDVIQGEYGYEQGEFTVYAEHWHPMYLEGLTPAAAFKRALDAAADARRERERQRKERWAEIQAADCLAGRCASGLYCCLRNAVYDQATQVCLECPSCGQYMNVPRHGVPFKVKLIRSECPECHTGDRHTETWYSSPGVEVSQDDRAGYPETRVCSPTEFLLGGR